MGRHGRARMVWLIGNKGMLGSEVAERLEREGLSWVGTDREVDITDPVALADFAAGKDITWIVNCAAYTAVDKAEDESGLAARLNRNGPANIGELATRSGARVIHISTDYVFDGLGTRPYREDDPVNPAGVYGRTKAEGETALLAACPRSFILRTAWLYGRRGQNFVRTMLRLMKEKSEIGVVADQRGTPTNACDLADAVAAVLRSGSDSYGIYHFTDEGETSWYEFAREIQRLGRETGLLDHDCAVKALRTDQYPTAAHRPAYSVLSKEKIKKTFGLEIPDWRESLERFIIGERNWI